MDFKFPADVEKFRQEVCEFVLAEWHPDPSWEHLSDDPPAKIAYEVQWRKKLAEKGWLAAALPKEFGGASMPLMYQYVMHEELDYYDVPLSNVATGIVAPTLLRIGTEDQKRRFIPPIVSGEIDFCVGYTEPNAGSDLASLQTRAVQDGDDFIINGQKIFTSMAHKTDWCWLAARTDPSVPKHKGISVFMIDMKTPGITVKPIMMASDHRANATYWDDVRVPKENLIGEMNRGWYYVATALDFERITVNPLGKHHHILETLVKYAKETTRNGKPLKDDPDVREKIAKISSDLQIAQLISLNVLSMMLSGEVPNYEASMLKMYATELQQRMNYWGTQILGHYGTLPPGTKHAPYDGKVDRAHRRSVLATVVAGSNEIQRNIIATRGLGLPR